MIMFREIRSIWRTSAFSAPLRDNLLVCGSQ